MMMRVGITGHQRLKSALHWDWVRVKIDSFLDDCSGPVIGVTSLAIGADQLFADAVLEHQGSIEAIIPFPDYEERFLEADKQGYRRLLKHASKIEVLQRIGSDEDCYYEAGKEIVRVADVMIAVWNGKPALGLGGTADVVNYARSKQKTVIHLNPDSKGITRLE